jgi:hypothetical protein
MLDVRERCGRWAVVPTVATEGWWCESALSGFGSAGEVWVDLVGRPRCEPLGALLRLAKDGDVLAAEMVEDLVVPMLGPLRRRFFWLSEGEICSEMWAVLWRWPRDRVVLIPTLRWEISRNLAVTVRDVPVGSMADVMAGHDVVLECVTRHEEVDAVLEECAPLLSAADVELLRWSRVQCRSLDDIAGARGINVLSARVAIRRAERRLVAVAHRVMVGEDGLVDVRV